MEQTHLEGHGSDSANIVNGTGADRGLMMAESGYQSGIFEATRHTNITLTSIADLKATLAEELGKAMLRSILERIESCRERYWAMSKTDRQDRPGTTA